MEKNFDFVFKKIDYVVADLKDHVHNRMDLVGNKIVTNRNIVVKNKE